MTRCEEFYDKVERDGNFCGMEEAAYRRVLEFAEFQRRNPTIVGISEGAGRPLISEKDPEVKAKAIEAVKKNISQGNVPTAKQVKTIIENKRAGVKPGGRIQSGQNAVPNQHALPMNDFFSDETKDDSCEPIVLCPEVINEERDYYSGDTPKMPDEEEKQNECDMLQTPDSIGNPETQKRDIAVPADISDIADKMKEERVVHAAKDLQRQKGEELQKQKEYRTDAVLEEKDENILVYDSLVVCLSSCLKEATKKRLPMEYIHSAIEDALNIAFEARADTPENLRITEYTPGDRNLQKLKARAAKQEAWALEDAKKEEEQ